MPGNVTTATKRKLVEAASQLFSGSENALASRVLMLTGISDTAEIGKIKALARKPPKTCPEDYKHITLALLAADMILDELRRTKALKRTSGVGNQVELDEIASAVGDRLCDASHNSHIIA